MSRVILDCIDLLPHANGNAAYSSGLNLKLNEKTITCIVGPCDSGKTAYARLLGGIDRPENGKLFILQQNVWNLNKSQWQELRRRAGYVLPNSALLSSISVLRNIVLPAQYHNRVNVNQIERRAREILDWLDYSGDEHRLPGYLSEYQRRLVAIARCMILNPKILFIDEAFAFLDATALRNLSKRYLDMRAELNMTLVLATHNLSFASEHADTLVFMHPEGPKIYHDWDAAQRDPDPYIKTFIHANFSHNTGETGPK